MKHVIHNVALVEFLDKIIIVSFENLVNGKYLYPDKAIEINCVSEVNKAFIVVSSSQLMC